MPRGYPKDGRPPGNIEALRRWREKTQFQKNGAAAKAAGEKSGESRRALRQFRDILEDLLTEPTEGGKTLQDKLTRRLIESIGKGDMQAYALMLKLIGQYPEEKIRATIEDVPQIVDDIRPISPKQVAVEKAEAKRARKAGAKK